MIDLRQLRYFVTVAETLHFSRAAELLNVTQPPLSRQIAALEKELGVVLIERHSRRVRLTHAGERFLVDARAVLAGVDQACRNAKAAQAGDLGELMVGFMMHAAYSSVPALTRRMLDKHPGLKLHLRETLPPLLVAAVLDGRFDAGISFDPGSVRGLSSKVIHRETLCLAAPSGHRLATHDQVVPEDLRDEPLIMSSTEAAPSLRRAITDYLMPNGEDLPIRLETQLQQTVVSLVGEGIGIALVPQSLQSLALAGVSYIPLMAPPVVEHRLLWRSGNSNPALGPFLDAAEALS
jgi:DNA-binding transcriptional LysR family regulator